MTLTSLTATERLRLYRLHHRLEVDRSSEWDRCDTAGVRVHLTLNRPWYHDPSELRRLEQEAAREDLDRGVVVFTEAERVSRVISEATREFEAMVVEDHGGYVVTADVELPSHNHFDIWDANDGCPRCRYDVARAGG
jgi:hypothetical protein